MITLNNKIFAINRAEQAILEREGKTVTGFYSPYRCSISLLDLNQNKVGDISNRRLMRSSCYRTRGYYADGKTLAVSYVQKRVHIHSDETPLLVGEYASYKQKCDEIDQALETCKIQPHA